MSLSPIALKLEQEQRRLLAAAETIEAFVAGPHPERVDALAALRWTFTRELLLHFAHVEGTMLQPLAADVRADVAALAARSSHDLANVYRQFTAHAERWHGLPPAERWEEYRQAVAQFMRLVRARLATQQRDLYPLLPARPGGARIVPACEPVNYAAEAWRVRGLIYAEGSRGAALA